MYCNENYRTIIDLISYIYSYGLTEGRKVIYVQNEREHS